MNAEYLANPDLLLYLTTLLVLGAATVGFLIGYLTKNFLMDKKVKEIENTLEKHLGRELDDYFKDAY